MIKTFKIKNPSTFKLAVSMIILIALIALNLSRADFGEVISYISLFLLIVFVVILIYSIIRMFSGVTEIRLYTDRIKLNNKEIEVTDIEMIMINGYFRPVVGIKPKGKKIVPVDFCFNFFKEEEKAGIEYIIEWSKENNINMVNRFFIRWI